MATQSLASNKALTLDTGQRVEDGCDEQDNCSDNQARRLDGD